MKKPWSLLLVLSLFVISLWIFRGFFQGGADDAARGPSPRPVAVPTFSNRDIEVRRLLKLAAEQKPELLSLVRGHLESRNLHLGPLAIRALGAFATPEGVELAERAWMSGVPEFRLAAVDSLGMKAFAPKKALALKLLASSPSAVEQAHLKAALLWHAPKPEEKTQLIGELLDLAGSAGTDASLRAFLASQLLRFGKGSRKVEQYLDRQLAMVDSLEEPVLLGVLWGMKNFCPKVAVPTLDRALQRKTLSEAAKSQILAELPFYPADRVRPLIARVRADSRFSGSAVAGVEKALATSKPVCR